MTKKTKRMVVDGSLTVLLIAAMFVQLTGITLHEIIGAVFFVLIVVHLALSFKWMKGSARLAGAGKLKGRTLSLVVMAVLLAIDIIILGISSVIISRTLASVGLASTIMSSLWKDIHTVSSYALCVLTVVHLGMHWATMFSWARIPYNPARRAAISAGVNAVAAVGVIALAAQCASAMELIPGEDADGILTQPEDASSAMSEVSDKPAPPQPEEAASSSQSASASESVPESASQPTPPQQPQETQQSSSASESGSGSSSQSLGICTLCKKRCPLSNPQCDRPYLEGLL